MQPQPPPPVQAPPPAPRASLRVTTVVATVGWILTATCWLIALFVPWTGRGLLSSATLMDAVRLVGRGVVDSVVPSWAAALLLVPALMAILLLALAGFRGRWVLIGQAAVAAVGALASLGIAWKLMEGELGKAGLGVWVSLLGVVLAAASVAVAVLDLRAARRDRATTPLTWAA